VKTYRCINTHIYCWHTVGKVTNTNSQITSKKLKKKRNRIFNKENKRNNFLKKMKKEAF